MTKDEIKIFIAELLDQGVSLSNIQKCLQSEKGVNLTFLDLRLIASEITSVDWSKQNKVEKVLPKKEEQLPDNSNEDVTEDFDHNDIENTEPTPEESIGGETLVEVSRLTRPGALAHGNVKFISGVKADWILDQMGRLGLDKATGEPTKDDIKGFQVELQKILSQGM